MTRVDGLLVAAGCDRVAQPLNYAAAITRLRPEALAA
jgi:hypothetical protein